MNALKTLFALSLTLTTCSAVQAQMTPPDLQITKVAEKKKNATVHIVNTGMTPTGNFILRVEAWTPNGWQTIYQVMMESIPGCCPRIVSLEGIAGIEGDPTRYTVDADNRVRESNEANNVFVHRKAGR